MSSTARTVKKRPTASRRARSSGRAEKLSLLPQLAQVFNAKLDPNVVLQMVLGEAVKIMRANSGSLCLVNPNSNELEIEVAIGLPPGAKELKLAIGEGITGWVALHGRAARVGDVSKDARYVAVRQQVRSELAVPIEIENNVAGVLNVDSLSVNHFTQDDEDLLVALASQASKLIQNAWLYAQVNRKAQQLEGLFQIAQAILTQPTSGGILDLITRETTLLLNVPVCALFRLQPGGHHLVLESFHGPSTPAPEKIELPVEHSQLGAALVSSKPVWIPEVEKSEPILHAEMARQSGLVSMLAVPLVSGSDTHGLLTVYTQTRHRFANDEIQLLATLGSYSAMAIQRVRFNEQLMELEERLRQNERLSTLGLLAAELSHEIRNPLTVMKMLLHSLAKGVEGEHGRDIQIVMQKMEQLNQTVERVLRLSRAADAELEPLDLNEVVREVLLLTQRQFRQSAIQVFTELSSEPAMIRGDRVQLEQALLNLTLNAAQALEEDRRIYFATSKVDGACELVVRDTGHGIRGDQQKRLFEPFVSDKTGGTGLGLAIVKKIVDHHGGAIRWESSKKGTSFVMSFPASA